MRTPPTLPWIIRLSVSIYRLLIRGIGPTTYFRQYGDFTIQLFRECCQDAYSHRGIHGVLGLWLPSFRDAVIQMMTEVLCMRQQTSHPHISFGTVVSSLVLEYFHAPRVILRNFMWRHIFKRVEQRSWLKSPTNMQFEQQLRQWRFMGPRPLYQPGVDTGVQRGTASAFIRSSLADAKTAATLRQTLKADTYRGKQLRFSGKIKVEQVKQQAGLYIRTQGQHERVMPENVIQGTHGWTRYEATISVPEDALFVRFGLILHGRGQIWLANARLEVIEQTEIPPVSM